MIINTTHIRPGKKKALTLIEIMVSVAILSFGFILILHGFSRSLSALRISAHNLTAVLLAEEKISEAMIYKVENTGKIIDTGNLALGWDTIFTEEQGSSKVQRMHAAVTWQDGKRRGNTDLTTYLYIPDDDSA